MQPSDDFWMRLALEEALKGRFAASPNPMVGACLVRRGRLITKAAHLVCGGDHAEVRALRAARRGRLSDATLYVTLEPCATWGKTPPCTDVIIRSGVAEVVIGMFDPNPVNHGRGVAALRKAGIKVRGPVLGREAERVNEAFVKWIQTGLPFVTLKMAQSLDGKIATPSGLARWISSEGSRHFVHELRAEQDAVLVGSGTFVQDNPFLSPRFRPVHKPTAKPWRVVLDRRLKAQAKARIFRGAQLTFRVISDKTAGNVSKSEKMPGLFITVQEKKERLDMRDLLKKLAAMGAAKVLVEGGGELAWSFLSQRLVDRACWIVAPKFFGGRTAKTAVEGEGVRLPSRAIRPREISSFRIGEDWFFDMRF